MNQRLYEPCQCGSGKKMKFCCPDLAADWEKIKRLLEADQTVAALEHLNRVIDQRRRQGKPDNPALLAERISLLRSLHQDQWYEEVDRLCASFPNNARAIAWQGIKLLVGKTPSEQNEADCSEENLRAAMERWLSARELSAESSLEWVSLTLMLAWAMLDHDWIRPAVFILRVLFRGGNPPEWAIRQYMEIRSDKSIPLALKCFENFDLWPEVEQSPPLKEAWSKLFNFDWRRAEQELTNLASQGDAPAAAWRLLAEARLLLGKTEEASAALRTYIEKWPSSVDVFEAELLLLSIGPRSRLGWVPSNRREWKVLDIDRVQEAMISDSRCVMVEPSNFEEFAAEIRPRMASSIIQFAPLPDDAELTSADQIPPVIGHLLLFGKQTDRDASLVLTAFGERIEQCTAVIQQMCGDLIAEMSADVGEAERSWLNIELTQQFQWPKNLSTPHVRELTMARVREVLLRRWPNRPVECLGGRTFFEAAADPSLRMRLLALIDLEERLLPTAHYSPLFAELRSELGVLTPMEDGRSGSKRFITLISRYVSSESLSDNELIDALIMADHYKDHAAFGHLATNFLRRESLRGHEIAAFVCYNMLLLLDDRDEAAEWIEFSRGLTAKNDNEVSTWVWSLFEASWHLRRGDAKRSLEIVEEKYLSNTLDRNDRKAFLQMALNLGLLPPELFRNAGPNTESLPSQEPAGLWTPDSDAPADGGAGGGSGGKLWVPD